MALWMCHISAVLVKERKSYLSSDVLIFFRFNQHTRCLDPYTEKELSFHLRLHRLFGARHNLTLHLGGLNLARGWTNARMRRKRKVYPRQKPPNSSGQSARGPPVRAWLTGSVCKCSRHPCTGLLKLTGGRWNQRLAFKMETASEAWPSQCISFPSGPLSRRLRRGAEGREKPWEILDFNLRRKRV